MTPFFSVIASMAHFAMRGDLAFSLLSPLNAFIRGPQYLKTFRFPIEDFGNDEEKPLSIDSFFLPLTLPGRGSG